MKRCRGIERHPKNYARMVKGGTHHAGANGRTRGTHPGHTDYAALADADLVIEAVFENIGVKKQVFKKLDETMKPGAILATNTSTLDIDQIAAITKRPQDVVGMHFFSPANVMKLLEVVRGEKTAKDVLATVMALGQEDREDSGAVARERGFIGNRMLGSYTQQAGFMLERARCRSRSTKRSRSSASTWVRSA